MGTRTVFCLLHDRSFHLYRFNLAAFSVCGSFGRHRRNSGNRAEHRADIVGRAGGRDRPFQLHLHGTCRRGVVFFNSSIGKLSGCAAGHGVSRWSLAACDHYRASYRWVAHGSGGCPACDPRVPHGADGGGRSGEEVKLFFNDNPIALHDDIFRGAGGLTFFEDSLFSFRNKSFHLYNIAF